MMFTWFRRQRQIIAERDAALVKLREERNHFSEELRKRDAWKLEHRLTKENTELRKALLLAERENDQLYRIVVTLRLARTINDASSK